MLPFSDELLPIVHQLWPSFKQRFRDPEKVVVIKVHQLALKIIRTKMELSVHTHH